MVAYCYQQIVQQCLANDALPVLVFLPMPANLPLERRQITELLQIASNSGFATVDLSEIFSRYRPEDLMLHDKGYHSNAKAQSLVAAALYERLTTDPHIQLAARARRIGARFAIGSLDTNSPH